MNPHKPARIKSLSKVVRRLNTRVEKLEGSPNEITKRMREQRQRDIQQEME